MEKKAQTVQKRALQKLLCVLATLRGLSLAIVPAVGFKKVP